MGYQNTRYAWTHVHKMTPNTAVVWLFINEHSRDGEQPPVYRRGWSFAAELMWGGNINELSNAHTLKLKRAFSELDALGLTKPIGHANKGRTQHREIHL